MTSPNAKIRDSNMSSVLEDRGQKKSKTKCCVTSAIGLLLIGGIIAIIVVVTGGDNDNNDNGGGDNPQPNNDPLTFQEFNPFQIDNSTPIES